MKVINFWKESANSPLSFQISHNEVHIWSASLEPPSRDVTEFFSLLSRDEKERADRFYFERDRNRYITGRGILRTLLGNYLGADPAQIEFVYGVYGKPALGASFNKDNFQFNLSHSKDKVVYAFNWDQPLGIDIEHVHPMKNMDDFAAQFFTSNECEFMYLSPNDQRQESFFKIWTCKEAFLKANGSGLTVPINQVELSLVTEGNASLVTIGEDRKQAAQWRFEMFTPFKDYLASLSIEGHEKQIVFQQVDPL